ncbi:MAG: hypothetical protein ACFFA2_01880 [Promethearchaeota archaeon]
MINQNVIDLDRVFYSRGSNFLSHIMDKFMDKLLPIYMAGKSNGKISDSGGKKVMDCWYYLCKFLDSLGILFFDKHERILEEGKNYGIAQLAERMEQWRENRRRDALIFLVKNFGPDELKDLK